MAASKRRTTKKTTPTRKKATTRRAKSAASTRSTEPAAAEAGTVTPMLAESMAVLEATNGHAAPGCDRYQAALNTMLENLKNQMYNRLGHCDDHHGACNCGRTANEKRIVDLIILLDSSGSMSTAAEKVSAAAEAALKAAAAECPSELRANWFVVDSSKSGADSAGDLGDITLKLAGTPFKLSHQQYLEGEGVTGPFEQDKAQPAGDYTYPGEEGADAVADLSNFYDWRPGSCRAIFYISDDTPDGPSDYFSAAAANAASAAIANGVVVFAHKVTPGSRDSAEIRNAYESMTVPTGGSTHFGPVPASPAKYEELLINAVCRACNTPCRGLKFPAIEPCVSIAWGASDCECFETDDVEIATVSVCNCYSNVTLRDVTISYFHITMDDGSPVPLLPDGTPSVQIVPMGPICFGDIGPCKDDEPSCVSRQIVIRTRGAKGGKYKLYVRGICFNVVLERMHEECLVLELCQD